ncbi:MAG: thymidine phosphorylase [Candidatus Pacearchaeota archaeon]|nr:thymidine phosphorylase [Candidatus Pacearchaeota archaeon]
MRLKVKFLRLEAGRPVAILHKNFAKRASIHIDGRIYLEKGNKKVAAVVDTASGMLKEDEIILSAEILKFIDLKENEYVHIDLASKPESLNYIYKKLSGKPLTKEEIRTIIKDIVNNIITESEIAFFVSAVYKSGMSMQEIFSMIESLVESGKKLNIKGKLVDKHSIGGIPGRTTPIVVAICASTGLILPKTSSRAITTPAGTADALEVICKVDFSIKEMEKIIKKTNACLVWGGALNLAPADDKLIQVERLLNIDPESQLLASIMSKKISVGAKYVLIDIPYGKNAKVNLSKAKTLEKKFKQIAKHFDIKLNCSLNKAEEPLGDGVGPLLEIMDVIKVLKREDSCHLLEKRSLELAGKLLELAGKAKKGTGIAKAQSILDSGKAFEKFKEIILAQKGKLNGLEKARFYHTISADKGYKIVEINIKKINELARRAGCPLDKAAGVYLHKHLNEKVQKGEAIITIYAESLSELKEALAYCYENKPIVLKNV